MDNKQNNTSIQIKLGILSKSIIIILITFYLLSYLNKNFLLIFSNMPIFTLFWCELWRFLTGPFISENLPNLFINVTIISLVLNYFENIEGTLKTLKSFMIHIVLVQLLVLVFNVILIYSFSINHVYAVKSLTPLNIAYVLEIILITNKKHITTFQSIEINNRFLFIFYLILFIFFNLNSFILEVLIGLYYGFLISKYKGSISIIHDETIFSIEKAESYKTIVNIDGYITLEDAIKSEGMSVLNQEDDIEHVQEKGRGAESSGVSAVSNMKGNRKGN